MAVKASMEPRPHERGNSRLTSPTSTRRLRFNGATSSRTWKHVAAAPRREEDEASMEPRPHERGNGPPKSPDPRDDYASMEPRPHERGNGQPASPRRESDHRLQWSHVLTNVETRRRHDLHQCRRQASMEPRPHERGNVVTTREGRAIKEASMEPRPHERGNSFCSAGRTQK